MILTSVPEIASELMQSYLFYQALFNFTYTKKKIGKFFKVATLKNRYVTPFVLKSLIITIILSI